MTRYITTTVVLTDEEKRERKDQLVHAAQEKFNEAMAELEEAEKYAPPESELRRLPVEPGDSRYEEATRTVYDVMVENAESICKQRFQGAIESPWVFKGEKASSPDGFGIPLTTLTDGK